MAKKDPSLVLSGNILHYKIHLSNYFIGPLETLESHLIVFKAENARKQGNVVTVDVSKDLPQW